MLDLAFGWNNVDNLSTISDWVYGSTHSATMGYDSRDRLSTVTRSGDNQIVGLDASGNRTAHNRAGALTDYTLPMRWGQVLSLASSLSTTS